MSIATHAAPQHVDFWAFHQCYGIIKMWAELPAPQMTKLATTDQPMLMEGPHLSNCISGDGPQVRPSDPRERRVAP